MFNVYPYSAAYGIVEELRTAYRVNSRTRINNDATWKDPHTMHTPLFVLDAHIQAVSTNRLEQARRAELIRIARANRPSAIGRLISMLRRVSGDSLVAIGRKLQPEPESWVARELEARNVTNERAFSSR